MDDYLPTQPDTSSSRLRRLGLRPAAARGSRYTFDSDQCISQGYRIAQWRINGHTNREARGQKPIQHLRRRWCIDSEDGVVLARSKVKLPSDGHRLKPCLERQEAFRVPKNGIFTSDVVENDTDLYRLGLLYDDEHTRGSGFDLDSIVRSEPTYAVRPAKRQRKSRCTRIGDEAKNTCLPLNLSFSSLGNDLALAQYLAVGHDKQHSLVDEAAQRRTDGEPVPVSTSQSAPLHIIYELDEDSTRSLAPLPAVDIFPDLVSDSEGEEDEYGGGWDMVPHLHGEDSDLSAGEIDGAVADDDDDADAAADAWIVLGET